MFCAVDQLQGLSSDRLTLPLNCHRLWPPTSATVATVFIKDVDLWLNSLHTFQSLRLRITDFQSLKSSA